MTKHPIDPERLVVALHRLNRERLLVIAERAVGLVPRARLRDLVENVVSLDALAPTKASSAGVIKEVRQFHEAAVRGDYYESFNVNSKNYMDHSKGTEAFIAEFGRLMGKCVAAARKPPRAAVRDAFEQLFALLRRIDEGEDDVIFFADEGGAWQVHVEWRTALPAYFACLAEASSPEEFAREVDRAIGDFDDHERPRLMTAARRVATAEQKAALRALPPDDT